MLDILDRHLKNIPDRRRQRIFGSIRIKQEETKIGFNEKFADKKIGMVINLDERHYYVSRSLEEKNEGPYCFRSIKEAAEAIPDGNREKPSVLYLEQDVYWTNGTPDSVGLVIQKEWLTLCGLEKSQKIR